MAFVEPNVAVYPTLHMPVHSEGSQQHKYSIHKRTHTIAHTLTERWFSLVKSVCQRQAGPLQQSSGVRGAICQWKTISGERSVPLVLMSTAGSFCSQRQHAKVIKGWVQRTAESHSHRRRDTHTLSTYTSIHFHLFLMLPMCQMHIRKHTQMCPHNDAVTQNDKWTKPCHFTPHPSISSPFKAIHLPPHHRRHWKSHNW